MGEYVDIQREAQEALEQRQRRRQRLLRGTRGLLRQSSRPRLLAVRALLLAALPGLLACWAAAAIGINPWGPAPAVGILVVWLGYDALMRREGVRLGDTVDFWQCFENGIALDDVEEARLRRGAVGILEDRFTPATVQNVRLGVERGFRSSQGNGAAGSLLMLIFLGCITAGLWLFWYIIETAPALLAAMIVDDSVPRRHPETGRRVEFMQQWRRETLLASGICFWALAVVALIFGAILWLTSLIVAQRNPPPTADYVRPQTTNSARLVVMEDRRSLSRWVNLPSYRRALYHQS